MDVKNTSNISLAATSVRIMSKESAGEFHPSSNFQTRAPWAPLTLLVCPGGQFCADLSEDVGETPPSEKVRNDDHRKT